MSSRSNGRHHAPSEYPPPVDSVKEFVKLGLDGEDERIDVGVAIVGGGTAGLACANRLLQLLGDDPELLESLGEVPVAVIEKAKTCGGHNLSGAVMRPGPAAGAVPGPDPRGLAQGALRVRRGHPGVDLHAAQRAHEGLGADVRGAELQEPRQRGRLRLGARPLPAGARRGGRRLHPHRDRRVAADRRAWARRRRSLGRQGPRQGGGGARKLRAGHRHRRQGDGARRGLLGPSHRRRDQAVRPRRPPRAAGLGARRQGAVEGSQAARSRDPHARAVAAQGRPPGTATSAARGCTR